MEIPADLRSFLNAKKQLEYDVDECEMGAIELLPLESLQLHRFPTDVDNGPLDNSSDPHYRQMGCYLVPAVSLIAECEGYDPFGLLLWFPVEKCYGTWDSSHTLLEAFSPDVTWSDIAKEPAKYLNAFWDEPGIGGLQPLIPWPHHEYDPDQPHQPRPAK